MTDLGLLILRLGVGGMMLFGHGWGKLENFTIIQERFPDPIGLGPAISLALAIFAEVCCAAAIMAGAFTRFVSVPLVITMLVAFLVVHGQDPWDKKELSVMYLVPFLALIFTGAGKFSVDRIFHRWK